MKDRVELKTTASKITLANDTWVSFTTNNSNASWLTG